MRAVPLPERSIIRVSGADARHFLQGLVTNDVEALAPGKARFAALLTPQGKILFDFLLAAIAEEEEGGFIIDAPKALAGDLAKRLGFYKLRAKVEIAPRDDLAVIAVPDGDAPEDLGFVYRDPRHARLGARVVLPAEGAAAAFSSAGFTLGDAAEWQSHRIALGIPEGGQDFIYGDTFPHEADMDQLSGVDFKKGCFVGQEVVSRMQHRGTARTRVVPIAYQDAAPLAGVEVKIGERPVGFVGSTANGRGLAKIRLDHVADGLAARKALSAGNLPIRLIKPDWATFPFPGETAP